MDSTDGTCTNATSSTSTILDLSFSGSTASTASSSSVSRSVVASSTDEEQPTVLFGRNSSRHITHDAGRGGIIRHKSQRLSPPLWTMFFAATHIGAPFVMGMSLDSPIFIAAITGLTGTIVCIAVTNIMDPGSIEPDTRHDLESAPPPHDGEGGEPRWCHTCMLWRPPRASHCSHCGFCVREFDHHCGVVQNCIGERNRRPFTLIIVFAGVAACALFAAAILWANSIVVAAAASATSSVDGEKSGGNDDIWGNGYWYLSLFMACYFAGQALAFGMSGIGILMQSGLGLTAKRASMGKEASVTCGDLKRAPCTLAKFWLAPPGRGIRRSRHRLGEGKGYSWFH